MISKSPQAVAGAPSPHSEGEQIGRWTEISGLVGLLLVAVYYLTISWRTWNHPLIDFGRELYIPWRLSEGAVLYRDVDDVYGPLSQYFNAGLFRLFGPGLMVLVTANLVIFAAILALGYWLFRRAWGATGALAACLVFVSVFAFSQYLVLSNFNYATPYAHEATHGLLVCLTLVVALGRWLERPTGSKSFFAGLLVGLALVLKPEFILAGGAVTATAFVRRWRKSGSISIGSFVALALGAALPTAVFALYFARHFPAGEAVLAAGRAWSSVIIHPDILGKKYQLMFLGLDDPWNNLVAHGQKTLLVIGALGALGGMTAFALKRPGVAARWSVLALATGLALTIGVKGEWGDIGRCLLGLNLLYLGLVWSGRLSRLTQGQPVDEAVIDRRILLGVLAAALMSRMFLSGRIMQFGFVQAALAAMVVVAVVFAESAEWMTPRRGRRRAVACVAAALLVPGIVWCSAYSRRYLKAQDFAVGEGRDRFYTFPPNLDATGYLVNKVVEVLRELPRGSTLFALPEGEMINYLARRPSPLPQFQFYSFTTEGGRELAVVAALEAHPPDVVVIISRDLKEFGITQYGERDGGGRQIMQWLGQHYQVAHHIGDDPLNSDQRGAYVLQRKAAGAAKN
ncbi:MAG: hypothetical protein EXS32_11955 [Opitutus sp.]|nr:hypothetical protein [Opitutus sp.]